MKYRSYLFALIILSSFCGCSVMLRGLSRDNGNYIYPATMMDVQSVEHVVTELPDSPGDIFWSPIILVSSVISLPFSVIVDTLTLPSDLKYAREREAERVKDCTNPRMRGIIESIGMGETKCWDIEIPEAQNSSPQEASD